MPDLTKAHKLAAALGCTIEYRRTRHAKHADIYLPAGTRMEGSLDCDALHHECELDEDIWPGVLQDLQTLNIEPIAA